MAMVCGTTGTFIVTASIQNNSIGVLDIALLTNPSTLDLWFASISVYSFLH